MLFVKPNKLVRSLFPNIIWKNRSSSKKIWLTFDDGPDPISTNWILELLKKLEIKATFFLIGEMIVKFPELENKIRASKHIIGNHSFSHKNGWITNYTKYIEDVNKCQKLMKGNSIFRPPYGKLTPRQQKTISRDFKIVLWDILSLDFKKNITKEEIKKNVLSNVEPGSIIVFHNNQKSISNLKLVLEEILTELKNKGFSFSTTW